MDKAVPEAPWRDLNILLLEDNAFQREVYATMLGACGCASVTVAADGRHALEVMARGGMDVVFCDLQNLDPAAIDGVEFIRHASKHAIGSMVLISALGADLFAAAEMLASGYRIPLAGCLQKPLRPDNLRRVLAACKPCSDRQEIRKESAPMRLMPPGEIADGLRRREFVPFFQPKVDLASGRIVAVEMLARWNHPGSGILPPGCFIPWLEQESGLDELTEQLYRRSLEVWGSLSAAGHPIAFAINASPRTLQDVRVPDRWRAIANEYGVATENITIEITETAIAENFHGLLETVTRLRMHGFGVSLDDFGTSFSSLQQLSELPITEMKIDRSFVLRAPTKERAAIILDSIIALSHKLGLKSVAEGIESAEDLELIRNAGCDQGQGYYFGKPTTGEELCRLLDAQAVLAG